jgi:hypothetical protein
LSFIIPWSPHPTTSHQTNRPSDPTQMGALLYRLTSNVGRTATTAGSSSVPPLNPNSTTASTTTPTIGNLVVAHCICLLSWKRGKEEEPEHVPHQHQRSKMTHPCRGPSIVHPRRVALRLAPSSWERRRIWYSEGAPVGEKWMGEGGHRVDIIWVPGQTAMLSLPLNIGKAGPWP